jgi:DNA polymerase-3 subunit epsilon
MQIAFHRLRLKTWPWPGPVALVEDNRDTDRTDILVVYNWVHIATLRSEEELNNFEPGSDPVTFDLDSYKLLVKALLGRDKKPYRIIELPPVMQPAVLMP